MAKIHHAFFDVSYFETLAGQNTPVHLVDPRAKVLTTLLFILMVVSFDKYAISGLLPFFVFPAVMITIGDLPLSYLLKKLFLVAPFAFFIGIFNPFLDKQTVLQFGAFAITGGWISFTSILLRFTLTVGAALILIATTGFREICLALEKFKIPRIFVLQLLFLYRYIFILIEEASRLVRARRLRTFNGRGMTIHVASSLIGHLLLRTINRARRIHLAMLCRGFDGEIRLMRDLKIQKGDYLFAGGWLLAFLIMRFIDIPALFGDLVMGLYP